MPSAKGWMQLSVMTCFKSCLVKKKKSADFQCIDAPCSMWR